MTRATNPYPRRTVFWELFNFSRKFNLSVNQTDRASQESACALLTYPVHSQEGSYLLEMGVVLVGVVALILGGSDIARILQGRGAVRAGVEEGLRCLTTTEDPYGCRTGVAPAGQFVIPPRFDVRAAGFEIPYRQIEVSSTWQVEPIWDLPTETFLGDDVTLQYSVPQRRLRQQEVFFR